MVQTECLKLRMKTVGNDRKRTYDIENESGRFGIFLHLAIKKYKKMVENGCETDWNWQFFILKNGS
jgi:hypothetical protein